MSRRIPTAPAVFWTVLTLVVLAGSSLRVSPVLAGEHNGGDESVFQDARHQIDDPPEVGEPGDDDQPTIDKKRGIIISAPASGAGATAVQTPVETRPWHSSWVNTIRAFVGRLGSMLRSPS